MKVLICGSRDWQGANDVEVRVAQLWCDYRKVRRNVRKSEFTIITGGARGVDTRANAAAQREGMKTLVIPADWKKHHRAAGPIRNRLMLDEKPDLVIAFWDGTSRGTKDTIDEARRRGIAVEVIQAEALL